MPWRAIVIVGVIFGLLAGGVGGVGGAGRARADGAPALTAAAPPDEAPAWMWSVGGLLRVTSADADADADLAALDAYGYRADAPVLLGLRGDLVYQHAPIVDVGVAWAWARGHYAAGPTWEDPDRIDGSTLELGAVARLAWARPSFPVAPEPRLEVGLQRRAVELRGVAARTLGTYTRVGVDVRLGARKAGAVLSVDYTRSHGGDDDAMLELPVGGVTVALSFYWRDWQPAPASPPASR